MAENVFARSPLQNALGQMEARRQARSVEPRNAAQPIPSTMGDAQAAPRGGAAAMPVPPAPEPQQAPADPIAEAANAYQVPYSALRAIADLSEAEPEQAAAYAVAAAQRLAGPMSQGMKLSEALPTLFPEGKAPDGFTEAVVGRAKQIYDERNPRAAEPEAEPEGRGLVETVLDPYGTTGELLRGAARGAVRSGAAAARAVGADETAAALNERADAMPQASVPSYRDIRNPRDLGLYLYGGFGESAPEMAGVMAAATGAAVAGAPAAVVGGTALAVSTLFHTGRNIERQEEETGETSYATALGAGIAQGFLDQIVPGKVGAQVGAALRSRVTGAVESAVAKAGGSAAARIGGAAATEAVTETVQGLIEVGQANPDLLRVMVNPQTPEEVEKADELLEEAINAFILGGALGAGFGGMGEVARPRPRSDEEEPDAGDEPLALEPPALVTPRHPIDGEGGSMPSGGAMAEAAPPTAPAGPIEAALGEGPAPVVPDAMPGTAVQIDVPAESGAQSFTGVVVGETADGVRIKLDEGEEVIVGREEIEAGQAVVSVVDPDGRVQRAVREQAGMAAPPVELGNGPLSGMATAGAQWRPERAAEIPQAMDEPEAIRARLAFLDDTARQTGRLPPKFQAERVELRQKLDAIEAELAGAAQAEEVEALAAAGVPAQTEPEAPAPVTTAQDLAVITKKDGSPFETEAQVKRAIRSRGLEPGAVAIEAVEGGFIARPTQPTEAPAPSEASQPAGKPAEPAAPVAAPAAADEAAAPAREPEHVAYANQRMPAGFRVTVEARGRQGTPTAVLRGPAGEEIESSRMDAFSQGTADMMVDRAQRRRAATIEPTPESSPPANAPAGAGEVAAAPAAAGAGEAATGVAASPAFTVENIRDKAAIIRGGDEATIARIENELGINFKWDERAQGFVFSRKHAERVRAALAGRPDDDAALDAAEAAGSAAFAAGKPRRVPAEWITKYGPRTPAAYLSGWDKANLAAPVDTPAPKPAEVRKAAPQVPPLAGMAPLGMKAEDPGKRWSNMPPAKREAVLAQIGGWPTGPGAKNALNPTGRRIAEKTWREQEPATRDTIIRLMEKYDAVAAPAPAATSTPAEIKAEAAEVDRNPTEGQKEAGNYQMGHVKVHGLDVTIETPKGGWRRGTAPDGTEWKVRLGAHYGYIRRTEGADGDHVDVYVGDNPDHPRAFIVDQFDPQTGKFDEHKVVLGVITEEQAIGIYDAGFSDRSGPSRRRHVGEYSVEGFKLWLRNGDHSKPAGWRTIEREDTLATMAAASEKANKKAASGHSTDTPQESPAERASSLVPNETSAPPAAPEAADATGPEKASAAGEEAGGQKEPPAANQRAPGAGRSPKPDLGGSTPPAGASDADAAPPIADARAEEKKRAVRLAGWKAARDGLPREAPAFLQGSDLADDWLAGYATGLYGANNKLVTADRAAELRERLKAKLKDQLNAGIDPEILAIGAELAVFHIEAGARSFTKLAKAIADDLGTSPAALRRYLRAWYNGARDMLEDSGMSIEGMDDADAVRAALKGLEEGTTDGVQDPVSERDARAGAEDVQRAPAEREDGRAPASEGGRGSADVRGSDREGAEAGERPAGASVPERGREAGSGDADRVSAREVGQNHRIAPGALDEGRGPKAKAHDNLAAIKLVRAIEAEGRPATAQEQETLARYVGWGGLASVFPDAAGAFGKGFEKIGAELRDILSESEYATARRTTQYAHYTAETVVRAMWEAAERLGFKGGSVFEPGMGTGNFAGMMPAALADKTAYAGLELDPTTARIARLLYPRWGVRQDDFTKAPLPRDAFDLVIGNPPFADIAVQSDPAYPQGFLLHDYFFAKSLDAVRPGGLLMFISSAGTLNKVDTKAREYLSDRAEFVGAVRLPGDAFERNAGTAVTTDIIVLRKFMPGERATLPDGISPWMTTTTVSLPDKSGAMKEGAVSTYFAERPEMVLGEAGFFDRLYAGRYAVRSRPGANLEAELPIALAKLGEDVMREAETPQDRAEVDFGSSERKEGSFYLKGDVLMQQRDGVGVAVEQRGKGVTGGRTAREIEIIRGLVPVRDALRAVYAADLAGDGANAAKARKRLNVAYDAFTQRHGPINKAEISYRRPTAIQAESARAEAREEARYAGEPWDDGSFDLDALATTDEDGKTVYPGVRALASTRKAEREAAIAAGREWSEGSFDPEEMPDVVVDKRPNIEPFADDPEHYRLRAIEHYNEATGEAKKSEVFERNVISREMEPEIRGVEDAVLYVLNQRGRFDLAEAARVAGMSEAQALEELGERVYESPAAAGDWLLNDEYLSGNVRQKLREARAAADRDPRYQRNVDALEAVQPIDLAPAQIAATLGMPWIPTETITEFATARLGLTSFKAKYTPRLAYWQVEGDQHSAAATSDWGTSRVDATKILDAILNKSDIKVVDRTRNADGSYTTVTNKEQTEGALAKAKEIREAFEGWVYQDEARADRLAALYNETYNNLVVRAYDGSYLKTPGVSTAWSWRPHQKRVVARIIQAGNTYMAHAVGAGKTSAMIGAGMEMRRLGLARKPLYTVPNHMLAQFTKEFYEQYPTARIAVADERQFHTDRRKQFIANVATSDLDAVVITHSAFGMIPISDAFQANLVQREIDEYRDILREIGKDQDTRITRKKIEMQIERLEQRLAGRAAGKRDQVFTFEEMGVDFLFVDEAHLFRKLDFATKMGSLKGIDPNGSDMAWNLYAKVQYLETIKPGRNLVLASGTPVTNTMAELFTLSRYIQPQELEARGLQQFDAWASAFGESVPAPEQDAAGSYKMVTRFSRFVNIPQLSAIVRQNVDVVTSRDLDQYVTRPKLKGGQRTMNLAERSDDFVDYQVGLARRIEAIEKRKGPPKAGDDIILSVINDGRKANIDMRMVDPILYRPDPAAPSKLDMLVDNVFAIWERSKNAAFHRPEQGGYSAKPVARGPATQLVFANLGLTGQFQVPAYIRSELVRRGVPRDEIAVISDFKTHVAKQRLFNDVNEGKIRVLIGSGPKMGVGTNVQRRLIASHNLDPLWYPADDEQRNGRALRQGNMNPEIEIHDYGLKGSYDSTMWQMMERKGRFIESFWNGDGAVRDMDDLGEAAFYEQAKALSTADPRVVQLTEMRQDLEKLQRRSAAFAQEQYALRRRVADAKSSATYAEAAIERWKDAIARRVETKGDAFKATIGGKAFDKRADAGGALLAAVKAELEAPRDLTGHQIGEIGGFPVTLDLGKFAGSWQWNVRLEIEEGYGVDVSVSTSEVGTIRSAEAILDSFEGRLARSEEMKARSESDAAEYGKRQGGTFKEAAALEKLEAEVKALTKAIYEPDPPTPPADVAPIPEAEPDPEEGDGPRLSIAADQASEPLAGAAALRTVLRRGREGAAIERAIDAGRIVLHDTEETLPGDIQRLSKGLSTSEPLDSVEAAVDAVDEKNHGRNMIPVGDTPAALLVADAPHLPVVIYSSVVAKAMNSHAMSKEDIKAALRGLYDPVLVFDSAEAAHAPDGSLVVIVEPKSGGRPISVAIHVDQPGPGRGEIRINRIATITDRKASALQNWLDQGLLRLIGRKGGAWVRSERLQLPSDGSPKRRGQKVIRWPGPVKRSAGAGRIQGMTDASGVVHLVASNLTAETALPVALHEMFHAGAEPLMSGEAWAGLMRRVHAMWLRAIQRDDRDGFWATARERMDFAQVTPEEVAAYAIEAREAAPRGLAEIVGDIIGRVQAYVLRRWGAQVGRVTVAELRALAAAALRASGTQAAGQRPGAGPRYSLAAALSPAALAKADGRLVSQALTKAMSGNTNLLALVPGRALFSELGRSMPATVDYLRLKEEMDAVRQEWHARTDDTAQAWRKLGVRSDDNAKLMDLMHEATLAGADPAEAFTSNLTDQDRAALRKGRGPGFDTAAQKLAQDQERQRQHALLRKRFRALPEAFQGMYRRVRDEYKALGDEFDATLEANVTKAMELGERRADRAYEDRVAEINDEGLTGEARDQALTQATRQRDRARIKARMNRRSRIVDLRAMFETQKVPAPYFPLARFGQFFVTTRDKEGKVLGFSRFEGPRAQEQFAAEQRKNPDHDVTVGVIGETALRGMVSPDFVAAVETILDEAEVHPKIMDAVWQRWLETMPDLSLRKSRIHRKGTPGFHSDAFRAFGHHMFHGSHQLARLRYSGDMTEALEIAKRQSDRADDPVRAGLVWEEMSKRHEFTMNPKGAWWSQALTSAAFVYYLSITPAAAIVNLSQTSIVGTAVLGAYGGVGEAAKHLTRALGDFTRGAGWAERSQRLTADERRALEEAYRRGTIDRSQAHDLAGVGETGVEYSAVRTKVMGVISAFFHHAERLNREVTFLAAYRMARDKGVDHMEAIIKGADLTWRSHFDYSASSRPRFLHSDYTKVLFVFRNFQVNMLWRLFRDTHQAINATDAAERKEALHQLAGITGMLALHGGVRGVWGYALIMSLASIFFGGDGDDLEDEMKGAVVDALGPTMGGMILNGVPGHLTGTDLTARMGMPELWFRSPDRQLEGSSEYQFWVSQMLGAAVGMFESAWRGASLVEEGKVWRGIETMAPKFVRDQMRAYRYMSEGATTLNGDPIIEDMAWGDAIKQSLGFSPAALSERYRTNALLKKREREITDERSRLMAAYVRAIRAKERPSEKLRANIDAFNRAHPTYPITEQSIRQSYGARVSASGRMNGGASLNPRLDETLRSNVAEPLYAD